MAVFVTSLTLKIANWIEYFKALILISGFLSRYIDLAAGFQPWISLLRSAVFALPRHPTRRNAFLSWIFHFTLHGHGARLCGTGSFDRWKTLFRPFSTFRCPRCDRLPVRGATSKLKTPLPFNTPRCVVTCAAVYCSIQNPPNYASAQIRRDWAFALHRIYPVSNRLIRRVIT